jgi:hypothetical protein
MFKMKGRRQGLEAVQVLAKILYAEHGPNTACSTTNNGRTDEEQPSSRRVFAPGGAAALARARRLRRGSP